ncbi:3-oxoacid CoA-transferase subunit A [Steroidobacter cummioxidans]|uniref:3-oxoacid CoA-transferase subunit A n=1 Tax=Steroidobacter cummioxidans TaxID=1803913 RepID=UPI000E323437|nr:3-oxoacid CoA-transferase subunit A [Steroidobacter cummioxidans]
MIDKRFELAAAVADVQDGATVLVGGFGAAGGPIELLHALIDQGARNLTVVSNNTGSGNVGLAALIKHGRVAKAICSFPRTANSTVFQDKYRAGEIELELVPQGTLAERLRAGGAGIAAFYTATAAGTQLAEGKETRRFGDREYVLEYGLRADFALIKCKRADRLGNLVYNKTARNFAPIMAMAARTTIVQAESYVEAGEIDPEIVVTPGVFVDRIVAIPNPAQESVLVAAGASYP